MTQQTIIMTFQFSLKSIAIELRTVIVCILCKLRRYSPSLHKNSWETRKWQVNLGQPGTFYHFSHAQTKTKHLTKRTNRLYPTKNTMGPRISKVAWITERKYAGLGHFSVNHGMKYDFRYQRAIFFSSYLLDLKREAKNRTLAIALVSSIRLMIITDVVVGRQTFLCLELKKERKRKLISSV